jgi:carboxyl-terminal processing protease
MGKAVLLAIVLGGFAACDQKPSNPADTSLFHTPATMTASPEPPAGSQAGRFLAAQLTVDGGDDFSPRKREQMATLLTQHHFKQPNIQDSLPHTATSSQLNQYLKSLDIYSKYLSPEENSFFQKRAKLERTDIGLNLLVHESEVLAIPIIGSPAYLAGLTKPCRLLSLNGKHVDFTDFSSYRFLTELTPGDLVSIEVADPAIGKTLAYSIPVKPYGRELASYKEYGDFAVITIHEFREITTHQIQEFLPQAMRKKALLIDLRYCPGGDLYSTVDMLSLFLPPKQDVVYLTRQGQKQPIALQSLEGQIFKNKPIFLLSSKYTASSAEVFIHAIRQYLKTSRLIGGATTGKCLALEKHDLEDGSALQLSAYEILTPNRQSCNGLPIIPDTSIPDIELLDVSQAIPRL